MIRWMCLCLIVLCGIGSAFAQEIQTFVSEDGSFSFEYPVGWAANPIDVSNARFSVVNIPWKEAFSLPEGLELEILGPLTASTLEISSPHEWVFHEIQAREENRAGDILVPSAEGTLQPLDMPPVIVIDLTVEGRSLAYGYFIAYDQKRLMDDAALFMVADVGNGKRVLMTVYSMQGGLKTLQANEATLVNIIRTMRYMRVTPPYSGNPNLPRIYSGPIAGLRQDSIEFYYPDGWFITGRGGLTNKDGYFESLIPESGQFFAVLGDVPLTRMAVMGNLLEPFNVCSTPNENLTIHSIVARIEDQLFSAHLKDLTEAGISVTQPEIITVNGVEIAYYREYQDDVERLRMFVNLGEGVIPSMWAVAMLGEMAYFEDQLFQVASTFRYTSYIPEHCSWPEGESKSG